MNRFGEIPCAPPANCRWTLFTSDKLPDTGIGFFTGDTLTLPEGSPLSGTAFRFPADGFLLLPKENKRAVLVCDFESEEEGVLTAGAGVCWRMRWLCNGAMVCDTTGCTNGEVPTQSDNHVCTFPVRKGHNRMMIDATAGWVFEIAFQWFETRELHFFCGPWTQFPENGKIRITFESSFPAPGGVDYRETGASGWKRVWDSIGGHIRANTSVHHVTLRDLSPGKTYEYRSVLLDPHRELQEIFSPVHHFTACPDRNEYSFSASADLQFGPKELPPILQEALGKEFVQNSDFFAFIGDIFWSTDFNQTVLDAFVRPYLQSAGERPLLMVHGNHEMYGRECDRFFDYFAPRQTGNGYFSFLYGETFFLVLDFCDDDGRKPWPATRALHDIEAYMEEERLWLREILETPECRNARYRIVLAHAIPTGDFNAYLPSNVRHVIDGLLTGENPRCRIHLWLGGHVHYALRSIPSANKIRAAMDPHRKFRNFTVKIPGTEIPFPVLAVSGPGAPMPYSFFRVDVSPEKICVKSLDSNGTCFDEIEIAPSGSVQEKGSAAFFREYPF